MPIHRTLKPALIGTESSDLYARLKNLLDKDYGLDATHVKTFDELESIVERSNDAHAQAHKAGARIEGEGDEWLILIMDDLPWRYTQRSSPEGVKMYFTTLMRMYKWGDFVAVFIRTQEKQVDWRGILPPPIVRLTSPPKTEEITTLHQVLEDSVGLERTPNLEEKVAWGKENDDLLEQIRALSQRRDLKDGKGHLTRLISLCLGSEQIERVEVRQLGQGKSGASVFRLSAHLAGAEEANWPEYVIKLCEAGAVWKLKSEVNGHERAGERLGVPGYRTHVPALKEARVPVSGLEGLDHPNRHIVRSGQWYAVHYDFLGGEKFGEFIDIETALVARASTLAAKLAGAGVGTDDVRAARVEILETVIRWLCENWYANPETGRVRREVRPVWDTGNADDQQYGVMPPYQLTGRAKGWIQSFLNGSEADVGVRFHPDWKRHQRKVLRLVSGKRHTPDRLGRLARPLPMLLSHVHGDLNANNVMLWLRHNQPFLIDFPFYQEAGHALQDLARLEVEIKFALLDRQKDSPEEHLKAFEHTYSQMNLWLEMEDRLLDRWEEPATGWASAGYAENVQFCFELVQLVRSHARSVQQQNVSGKSEPPGAFLNEYWPALLYQTVRAVGYPSLSIFKRLLAVYSAGSILDRLGCFTDIT